MLRSVSALVLDGLAVFEFGVICEVFGIDRSADGVPNFDFKVCGPEAGKPLRTSVGASLTPDHDLSALAGADLVAVPAIQARVRGLPRRGAGRAAGRRRRRVDHPDRVLGAFVAGAAGLLDGRAVHHPLDARRRTGPAVSDRAGRPQRAVRRRRQPDHQRGHRGRHRRLPAPGAPRTRQRGHQRDRPAHGGAAAARRRPASVHRPADPGAMFGRLCPATGLDRAESSRSRTPWRRWPAGPACPRARSPAGSSTRPAPRPCSGSPISGCCTRGGCSRRPTWRSTGSPSASGFGTAHPAAPPLPPHRRRHAVGLPAQVRLRIRLRGNRLGGVESCLLRAVMRISGTATALSRAVSRLRLPGRTGRRSSAPPARPQATSPAPGPAERYRSATRRPAGHG